MENFWEKLERPIIALAPMANSDVVAFWRNCANILKEGISR